MKCPNCRKDAPDGALECPSCQVVFEKWLKRREREAGEPAQDDGPLRRLKVSAGLAAAVAVVLSFRFAAWLPIPEWWGRLESVLFPLSALDLAFHEAGHVIFGFFGSRFLMTFGGTLMQLGMPAACLVHFLLRGNRAGVLALLCWLGFSLVDISFYAADAKLQAVILITGMSGSEGGGHDWNYMLEELGLLEQCVFVGRLFFFSGVLLGAFPLFYGLTRWLKKP